MKNFLFKNVIIYFFFLFFPCFARAQFDNTNLIPFNKKFIPDKLQNGKVVLSNISFSTKDLNYILSLKNVSEISINNCKHRSSNENGDFGKIDKLSCFISDLKFLDRACNLGNLKKFDLGCLKVTQFELNCLSQMTSLEHLSVTQINNQNTTKQKNKYSSLKSFKNLRTLEIRDLDFSDSDVLLLKDLPNLVELNIGYSSITNESFKYFKDYKNLTKLTVCSVDFSDTQLRELSLIKKLEALFLFDLNDTDNHKNSFTKIGFGFLCQVKNLRFLHLPKCDLNGDDFKLIRNLKNLEELRFYGLNPKGKNKDFTSLEFILSLPKIRSLEIFCSTLNYQDLEIIGKCKTLNSLMFHRIIFTEKCDQYFFELHKLRKISFEFGSFSSSHLKALNESPNLSELLILSDNITSSDFKLIENMQKLEVLQINLLREQLNETGIRSVAKLHSLRKIDLFNLSFPDSEMALLAKMPNLRSLFLEFPKTKFLNLAPFSNSPTLERLQISGSFCAGDLVRDFKASNNLVELAIRGNEINIDDFNRFFSSNRNCQLVFESYFSVFQP